MTLDQFVAARNGQWNISFDGTSANAGQCVQLVAFYVRDVLALPVIWADAAEWWYSGQFSDRYDRIPNTAAAIPQRGDIIVWDRNLPNSGGAGHVAVCLTPYPGTGTFMSFDSNWGGKYCHQVTHNYNYVVGWLRPKAATSPPPAAGGVEMITSNDQALKMYKMLRPNADPSGDEINSTVNKRSYEQFVNDGQAEVNARDANLRDQAAVLQGQQANINQLNVTITQLRDLATQDALKDDDVAKQLDAAHNTIASLTTELEASHDQLKQLQDQLANAPFISPTAKVVSASKMTKFLALLERLLSKQS